jgi:protein ImuB
LWPIEALRLPAATQSCLHQLGVLRIEQLAVLPRQLTAVRLGMVPFLRLDQTLGEAEETIVAHRAAPHYAAHHWFEYPTASRVVVQQALEFLMRYVAQQLIERQQGALQLDCRLDCATGMPLMLRLNFFRPTAAVEHWLELADMQFDQTALPGAVHRLALHAARTAPLTMRQAELSFWQTTRHEDSRQLAHLVNRLSNRLGREAVVRPQLCADVQPEQAYEGVPLAGYSEQGRRKPAPVPAFPGALHRPLLLHHPPRPLEVVAVVPDGPPIRCSAGA